MGNNWLHEHRAGRPYRGIWESPGEEGDMFEAPDRDIIFSRTSAPDPMPALLADQGFNNHEFQDGRHVSPFDEGRVDVGVDNLVVKLVQGIDEAQLRKTLRLCIRATNGIHPAEPEESTDPEEMFRGGLQTALESQVIVFSVTGASRVLTHQLVRSRRAAFHQQSQRATWYGDRPNARWPMSVLAIERESDRLGDTASGVHALWERAQRAAWEAYSAACDAGISYQDARYILPEGTTNYIICEYSVREFLAVFAYRGCSMFQWEMVQTAREMRRVLLEAHPFLEPYVKISCEKGEECAQCGGSGRLRAPGGYFLGSGKHADSVPCPACKGIGSSRKCTFQGWENVEGVCDFPWAKQSNRVFLPSPRNRIGAPEVYRKADVLCECRPDGQCEHNGVMMTAEKVQDGYDWCPDCVILENGDRKWLTDCKRCAGTGQVCQCLGYGFLSEIVPEGYDGPDPTRTCPTCKGPELSNCLTCGSHGRSLHPAVSGGGEVTKICPDVWHEGKS